ncbi:NIPSNAP family protein [Mesorhizobium sp. BAC0120]|uniref:NIPSNAP family protein n=1 Tax=Mesorhizobium sp. BAC0120 TaxID=3090670 RepID=UPI00298C438F|nr:NIPSNAP family protein [Mesorhizobium sp. BAC0120]MDW6022338.1 NIPSNAP family protein [Mesorhizobium sp. BAC0120]
MAIDRKQVSWHSPIIELRQYDLLPGMRETLIDVFDTHFIEGQETEGMAVIGQFRDLDNPDSFVWLRGFADMDARKKALEAFYSGPVWMRHRDAANATMTRFDNVLLLRPATPAGGFALDVTDRPVPGAAGEAKSLITINIIAVRGDVAEFAAWHRDNMLPILKDAGADVVAVLVTENTENNFPALPVRTDKQVLVILTRFADVAGLDRFRADLAGTAGWIAASKAAAAYVEGPPHTLRLTPTARSLLR